MSVTSVCADFANRLQFDDIPHPALRWAKWGILDCTGVGLVAATSDIAPIIRSYLNLVAGNTEARVLGLGVSASPTEAAMATGTLCHALDFDDVGGFGHSSAVLLPVVYALSDLVGCSGKEAITAYVAGYEIGACLADKQTFGSKGGHGSNFGWHATGLYGTIAAACTAARLLQLDSQATKHAIGIAVSEASGIPKNYGTMTKPLHAGLAARNGVFAALLAQQGFTADANALDGELGFLHAFKGPGDYPADSVAARLGKAFALSRGLVFKWHPIPLSAQRAISALISLVQEHALLPDTIGSIEADLRPAMLLRQDPKTGLEGKFCMAFNLAVAVLKGWPELADYTAARAQQHEIRSLMQRITHVGDPSDESAAVTVIVKDGTRYQQNVKHPPGSPVFGLQESKILAKFRACAGCVLSADALTKTESDLLNLDRLPDLASLMDNITSMSLQGKRMHA